MKTNKDKKLLRLLVPSILFLVPLLQFSLCSLVHAEVMDEFRGDIALKKDATADITETIKMDFGNEDRHGIKRHIPVSYTRNNLPFTIDLEMKSVTNARNAPLPFAVKRDGRDVDIKIGDADKIVHGKQTYKINYSVRRVINWFGEEPELYWNVTGTENPFPILKALAVVTVPDGIATGAVKAISFEGAPGSTKSAQVEVHEQNVTITSGKLLPDQGLTIAVRLPAGSIVKPSALDQLLFWLKDWYLTLLIPFIVFAFLYTRWMMTGKDIDGSKVAGVDWEPPKGLTPAEVGTLIDEKCDLQDITSTLVDLAVRGYLKIKKTKVEKFLFLSDKDYEFTRTDPPANAPALMPHEKRVLQGIFEADAPGLGESPTVVKASMLKYIFYPYLNEIRDLIYQSLLDKNLFFGNPETTRKNYFMAAAVTAFLAFLACLYCVPAGCGLLLSAILIALFAPAMPARTAEGSQLTRQCLGFQRFVKMAEKDRIKVLAAEDPTIFGRLLPYAMVLGAADQWANAFKDITLAPPDWYESDSYANNYSTNLFINDLGNSMSWFGQTFSAPPPASPGTSSFGSSASDGGSGFSGGDVGGGFGGGGSDSW